MDKAKQKPPQEAVAIRYDRDRENAPRVVAKGKGYVAEQLLAIARRHAVPVYQNQTVTHLLMAVELDREIPPELYQAVANVLAYDDPRAALKAADRALYLAKEHGRNQVCFYDDLVASGHLATKVANDDVELF